MSSEPPREKLTAWQRWELAALSEPRAESRAEVTLPTAAEIERLHQNAHAEGLAAGLAEGRGLAARREAELAALVNGINEATRGRETAIAEDLLSLALEFARRIVRVTIDVRPELIVPLVREAMQQMPAFSTPSRLVLNPADADLVREALGESLGQLGCSIVEDGEIERGGCRIESTATQVDATLATRWERIVSALGRDRAWLEPAARSASAPGTERGR